MKLYKLLFLAVLVIGGVACSSKPKPLHTVVKGKITVADSLDASNDFSGIGLTILDRDSSNTLTDTLFHEVTALDGTFEGAVQFPDKKYYTLVISRNNRNLGNTGVILADNDTLSITAELPDLNKTLSLDSREHEAMQTFARVEKSFQRIRAFAQSGVLADSQLVDELKKWSGLYWEVYEQHPNSIAAYLAAEKSAGLLNTWNQEEMLKKIDEALPEDYMISVALNLAKPYIAQTKGFDAASSYLDSLAQIAISETAEEVVKRNKITMYFDSSRVKEAKQLLSKYESEFTSPASKKWARRIRYDLNYLAPGVEAPDFSFVTMSGDTISNQKLHGNVFILEISSLANAEYQNDYDRTMIISEIYKNYGLKIFTIPLDQSELTVEGFFEDRRKSWSVAKLGSFDVQDIIRKFNVVQIPTRFLIDENGVVIRKYERGEFEDVIQGLSKAFRNVKTPS